MTEKAVAYEEAGHGTACYVLAVPFERISIIPDSETLGYVLVHVHEEANPLAAILHLAGPLARQLAGDPSAREFPIPMYEAQGALRYMKRECGSEDINDLGYLTLALLRVYWLGVKALAVELIKQREMSGQQACAVIENALPSDLRGLDPQQRRDHLQTLILIAILSSRAQRPSK